MIGPAEGGCEGTQEKEMFRNLEVGREDLCTVGILKCGSENSRAGHREAWCVRP